MKISLTNIHDFNNQNKFKLCKYFIIALLLSVILFSLPHIQAQTQQPIFEHYGLDNGLSAPLVYSILQDKTGYLWFGTYSGLDRFDGRSFKSYQNIPGDSASLTNAFIQCLFEDRAGNLWVGTANGLDKLEKSSDTFKHYKISRGSLSVEMNNNIHSIQEDKNGYLWLGTENGLSKFNPHEGTFKYYKYESLDSSNLSHNTVLALLIDRHDDLWVGTKAGLDKFDPKTESFIHYWRDTTFNSIPYWVLINKYVVITLFEDIDGNLWVGTEGGVLQLDSLREKFIFYESNPQDSKTLSYHAVTSICEVDENIIWIGTFVGLNLFDKRTKKFTRIFYDNKKTNGLTHNCIKALLKERSGTMWVATLGGGLCKTDLISYPFKTYRYRPWGETTRFASAPILDMDKSSDGSIWMATPAGLINFDPLQERFRYHKIKKNVRKIKEDNSGNLWVAKNILSGRGFIKLEKNGRINNITDSSGKNFYWLVRDIIIDSDSTLWACTDDSSALIKINTKTNKFFIAQKINALLSPLYKDKKGLIWIGTWQNGLYCYDPLNNKIIKRFISNVNDPYSISGNSILAIYEDVRGNLWLGTNNGLNQFDRSKNQFYHYTTADGLPHNRIDLIFTDSKQNLWLSTLKGISKFNPTTKEIKNYDVLHGHMASGLNGVGCQLDNGEIYIDSPKGLTRFHPDSVYNNQYVPNIVITNVSVMDKSIPFQEDVHLPYADNNITFEFSALSYVKPGNNLYAYKLEGFDNDWHDAGTNRSAAYTNLTHGEYTFMVKGSNNDGIWNETGAAVRIFINPPLWETIWAYMIYIILLGSIAYLMWKAQLKRIKIKHDFQMSKFEATKLQEVDEMKSRFFANISHEFRTPLTLIFGPAKDISEKTTNPGIKKSAGIIRRNAGRLYSLVNQLLDISKLEEGKMRLEVSEQNIIHLLKGLVLSFASLAERKRITFKFNTTEEYLNAYIDKDKIEKIIDNILSNAFKFTPVGGNIELSVTKNEEYIIIRICDSGIGIPKEKISKIFDRFYQVDATHKREHEGTGIGLALSKELIELHKGKIKVESVEGKGSIFTVSIPLGKQHYSAEEICKPFKKDKIDNDLISESIPFEEIDNDKINVNIFSENGKLILLLVEDNPDVRCYIRENLEKEYTILEAVNGEDGLKKSIEQIPDLIISDIMMPKIDGIELCEKLKTDERTSHIPIILLTAKATSKDKIIGYETGADDYIMKPFDIKELQARTRNLINQRKKLCEHFKKESIFNLDNTKITSIDRKFLEKSVNIITEHLSDLSFGVELFANELSIGRTTLYKKFIAMVGEPPGDFIKRIRLSKAHTLLNLKAGNISEIALEVGFNNPAYFSECFKKQFGISPSQYNRDFINH